MLEEIISDHKNNVTVPKMFSSLLIQMLPLIIEWPKYNRFATSLKLLNYFIYYSSPRWLRW